jgi:hypothetical protein
MSISRCLLLLSTILGFVAPSAYAGAEPRLALLIGNSSYKSSPLPNPVNDVRLMEGALKEAGFTVVKAENASIREMRRLVRQFGEKLKASGGVGLFYFAGHGVQVRGENFLVSTDSDIRNEDEVADDSINAAVILAKMQGAGNRMNLIILDACRNNPFASKSRSASSGLATMSAPSGSLVAYATAPGSVASDGARNNGLYTEHLARAIRQPGLPVEEVFKQVRSAVRKESNNQQTPWENTALEGQFFFNPSTQPASPRPTPAPAAERSSAADNVALELAMWDSVKDSDRAGELQAYLTQFPNGTFAVLAKSRIEALQATSLPAKSPAVLTPPAPVVPANTPSSAPLVAKAMSNTQPVVTRPNPQLPPTEGAIGTLVLTDTMTASKRDLLLTVKESNSEKTVYSSGDVIAGDGKVLQVRIGNAVIGLVSGALWTIPVKAGTSGEAGIRRVNVDYESPGKLSWMAVDAGNGDVRIEADVAYVSQNLSSQPVQTYGTWRATYRRDSPLAKSFVAEIGKNALQAAEKNMVSAELESPGAPAVPTTMPGALAGATQPVAARPNPPLPTEGAIGTLILTDTMTETKRNLLVTVEEANGEKTVYSSGDVIAGDGKVLQVRIGDAVIGLVSGALWTIPVKAGSSGEAGIRRADVDYKSPGKLSWKAVEAGNGDVRIEADVSYKAKYNTFLLNTYGTWQGIYSGRSALTIYSVSNISNSVTPAISNKISAELKLIISGG